VCVHSPMELIHATGSRFSDAVPVLLTPSVVRSLGRSASLWMIDPLAHRTVPSCDSRPLLALSPIPGPTGEEQERVRYEPFPEPTINVPSLRVADDRCRKAPVGGASQGALDDRHEEATDSGPVRARGRLSSQPLRTSGGRSEGPCRQSPPPRAGCLWLESRGDSRIGDILIQPVGWAEASRNAEAIFARLARPGY